MMKRLILAILLLNCLSCGMFDNFDEVPMFISIGADQVDLLTLPGQGLNTAKIKDVWAYADGFSIGVFELPATIPVLSDGDQVDLVFFAGVRKNGFVLQPDQYAFYESIERSYNYVPDQVLDIELQFSYDEGLVFPLLANFDTELTFTEDLDGDDTSALYRSTETPYGSHCAKIDLTPENALFQQTTTEVYSVADLGNTSLYLEMDYKCEVEFSVGYIGYRNGISETVFFIFLKPQEDWDKIYLDLSSEINGGSYDSFQILLAGVPLTEEGSVWVDNMKLIHFSN